MKHLVPIFGVVALGFTLTGHYMMGGIMVACALIAAVGHDVEEIKKKMEKWT